MKFLSTFLLCILASVALAQRFDVRMTVDSAERFFIVSKPTGTPPAGGYPMVFMLHGTSGDGEKFYNISGWKEKGETEKILTVFPSSLEWCIIDSGKQKLTTKWVNGDLQTVGCPGQTYKDDVTFFRAMVDTIAKVVPVDLTRVYVSGFSNGGVMAGKLAVEASDIFAAASISEATLHELDSGEAKRMIPLVLSIGTKDDRFYTPRGLPELPFNDSILPLFAGTLNRILDIFHLGPSYTRDSTALVLRYKFNTLAATSWYEFNFLLFNGLEHSYPNGDNYPASMPNLLWPFFQQYTLQSAVKPASPDPDEVTVWPNPAQRTFSVEAKDLTSVTVRSMLGEIVYSTSAYTNQRHTLPTLPAGVYVVEVQTKVGQHFTKLLLE